jgi:flagellar protein FliO/FliZ
MEFSDYMRFVIALAFVLALIATLSWAVKRYGVGGREAVSRGKSRRLQIVEIKPIDSRHRAVLLRRDDTEHLVLLGPGGDLVIESGIKSHTGAQAGPAAEITNISGEEGKEQT